MAQFINRAQLSYQNTVLSEPADYTYAADTGAFSTVAGRISVPAATFTQDPATGARTVNPGVATLTVTGTI